MFTDVENSGEREPLDPLSSEVPHPVLGESQQMTLTMTGTV